MTKRKSKSKDIDFILLGVVLVMMVLSVLMMYSISMSASVPSWIFPKHVRFTLGGLLVVAIFTVVPYTFWRNLMPFIMAITIFALVFVPFLGSDKYGAKRAFETGPADNPLSIQPGVVARLVAVMYVAAWASSKGDRLQTVIVGLAPFAIITGVFSGLIALQPDYSIALMIAVTGLLMFFFAGGDPLQIGLSLLIMGGVFYLIATQLPHVMERWEAFRLSIGNPEFQEGQTFFAGLSLRYGGLFGQGWGQGTLKYGYLQLTYNDTVLAVIGEELGLVGCLLVIGLFATFIYRGYRIAMGTPDPFGRLLAFGITTMIALSALAHALVIVHLIPFAGTALPFFTAGGSEMVVTMASVGLLLSISRGKPQGEFYENLDRRWRNWWTRLSSSRRGKGRPSYGS